MGLVREWVRHLVVLTLVAGMLEFLVPSNSMKAYVRTVMGLLVMLAMLTPVLKLLGQSTVPDLEALVPLGSEQRLDLSAVQREATRLAQVGSTQVGATFRARLAASARVAAGEVPGVERAEVSVSLGLSETGGGPPPVEAIRVRIWPEPGIDVPRTLAAVARAVAVKLGLDPARVQASAVESTSAATQPDRPAATQPAGLRARGPLPGPGQEGGFPHDR